MTDELPTHPVDAAIVRDGDRWSLRMERDLRHSPERVWAALTRADQIRHWAPYVPDRDLDQLGEVPLPQAEAGEAADEPAEPGRVLTADPPRLLELLWGDHQLRFELVPTTDGVRLVLVHTFDEPNESPDYAAGWHLCLDALTARLDGQDVPPVAGSAARDHGWDDLRAEYADLLSAAGKA